MSELTDFRRQKDQFMAHDHDSPLTPEEQRSFSSLAYYDEESGLRFVVDMSKLDAREVVEMQTSTGEVASYLRWGKIRVVSQFESISRRIQSQSTPPAGMAPRSWRAWGSPRSSPRAAGSPAYGRRQAPTAPGIRSWRQALGQVSRAAGSPSRFP